MSFDNVIRVKGVTKIYQIYDRPQDRLKQSLWRGRKQFYREFKALDDISFEVKKGEAVGIIGRNGSGKSTLLQIICGTLAPTSGDVEVNGRVAALLELGSGFNPEFTGRENVYMNAAVLGLSSGEIEARFDDIASFADIGQFIDQPVKTYSSGMYVRLAFAVIAHVDADILVIDEALAVGDAVFTQKCMRFLRRFMKTGTVLFVSHNVSAIKNLCQQAIWLSDGSLQMFSDAEDVSNAYVRYCNQEAYGEGIELKPLKKAKTNNIKKERDDSKISFLENIANSDGWNTGGAEITRFEVFTADDEQLAKVVEGGERMKLKIRACINQTLLSPIIGFFIKDRLGQSLFGETTYSKDQQASSVKVGDVLEASFVFTLPRLPNGEYAMTVAIADGDILNHTQHHLLHDAVILNVQSSTLRFGLVGIPFERASLCKVSVE